MTLVARPCGFPNPDAGPIRLDDLDAAGRLVMRVNLMDAGQQPPAAFWVDELRLVDAQVCPDFDASGQVDLADIGAAAGHWRSLPGSSGWDARFDLDRDDDVDVVDVMAVAAMWQTDCSGGS